MNNYGTIKYLGENMKDTDRDLQILNILKSIQVTATSIAVTAKLVDELHKSFSKPELTVVGDKDD